MVEFDENIVDSILMRSIKKDGFCVLYNPIYGNNEIVLKADILKQLPKDYVFIDYVYKINNVSLSTFHRDVTSSQNNYKTNYPVYTAILYKYNGDLLSLCPASNRTYPFAWSHIYNITGNSGTVFLFNCDLLHAGQINNCREREVIQYKLCHKSDLIKLEHLKGIRTHKTDICSNSFYNQVMRKLSYYFEFPINYIFYPIMIKRENTNTIIGSLQSFIPLSYYNNT
uniref:Phytanoyl-CoA dioxygenase n=1 Tax=viral metagenome TaxID=1070528 RepID=A0A6C0JH11_9ZZZZ